MNINGKRFYPIPDFSRYFISRDGEVFSTISKRLLTLIKNNKGYYSYSMSSDTTGPTSMFRHRLLCIVFKSDGIDTTGLVVNHINGIIGDDRLDNLEWVTYTENAEHAGRLGLTSKCVPCSVLDVDTGKITKYPSAKKAGEDLGLSKDNVLFRLRSEPSRVFPERKQYRLGNSDDPWEVNANPEESIREFGNSKSVIIKNLDTGELLYFPTVTKAAKHLKFTVSGLSKKLNSGMQPWYPPFYLVKYDDSSEWREVGDYYTEYEKASCSKVVILVGENDRKIFFSALQCAEELGISHSTVLYRVNAVNKPLYDGYKFYYYSDFTLGPVRE